MQLHVRDDAEQATHAAAALLVSWIADAATRSLMLAGGRTPLALYTEVGERLRAPAVVSSAAADLRERLSLFVLDEYVGVPEQDPRTCTNLLRRTAQQAWQLAPSRFFGLSPRPADALDGVQAQQERIEQAGGLDALVLGLGVNGHLGFNEPGSARDSGARLVELEPVSVEANRAWFGGEHAPAFGATVGLRTLLAARHVLLMAFGETKAAAVRAMLRGPIGPACPASFLQEHADAHVFVDRPALARVRAT